jgi:hypothetical protein
VRTVLPLRRASIGGFQQPHRLARNIAERIME